MTLLHETPTTRFTAQAFAPSPAEHRGLQRDGVRLLVARPGQVTHTRFATIAEHLDPGDVLVVNDSATVAGQVDGAVAGRPVVVHVATPLDDGSWVIELRTAPRASAPILDAAPGDVVTVGPVRLRLIEAYPHPDSAPGASGNRLWRADADGDLRAHADAVGRPISYGYLDRAYPLSAYQTVFSRVPGSAEMPSAARPFTDAVVVDLVAHGVSIVPITLHTGVSSQEVGEGPQAERFSVSATAARVVESARAAGGRVVAVGTTATRALESAVVDGHVVAHHGWTERVVTPEHPPQVVTGLVTGWHDPQASHLLLVEAVAGPALTQAAYDAAVTSSYDWHEFGDTSLLLP